MNIIIPIQFVPDLVEELFVDASGTALDKDWVRLIINEFDDHAVEQGILMQERGDGETTVLASDVDTAEDMLFTAAAKGARRLIKLTGDSEGWNSSCALATAFATVIQDLEPGIVLTGVQANTDLDGQVGPLLAEQLEIPYVGYVSGVSVLGDKALVRKEYPGGLIAELEVMLPAVIGVQSAEEPPRYVAFSKVRQMMKTAVIEAHPFAGSDSGEALAIKRMYKPETGARATMLEGDIETIASSLVGVLRDSGVL